MSIQLRFIKKPKNFMGDNIAVNWLSEKNPDDWGLKEGDIFVREDWFEDKSKLDRLKIHERVELYTMINFDISYEVAHKIANYAEHLYMVEVDE